MGWITKRLGNGLWGTVDGDAPDTPPQVSFNGTITTTPQLTQDFGRILNEQFNNNEKILFDKPMDYLNSFEYCGVTNINNTSSEPTWAIIRRTWENNRCVEIQFRNNMSWDDRVSGWSI